MFNTKRKRAVVLALIAFFCGATAFVAVDWKRFGGGFLALFQHKGEPVLASAGGASPSGGASQLALGDSHPEAGPPLALAHGTSRRHRNGIGGGSGAQKSDDDLFKYGDPAAGGIPAGSFLVAQNDTAGGGGAGGAAEGASLGTAPEVSAGTTAEGDTGGGGVSSPAPAPGGTNGGSGGGIVIQSPAPAPPATSPTPAAPTPPVASPPAQSGTSDQNPGDGGTDTPPVVTTPPVSAVPEASNAAMMGLGALFLAVAATRRRRNGQG